MWVIEGCRCQACVTVGNCYCGDTGPLGFKQSPAQSQQWMINTLPSTTTVPLLATGNGQVQPTCSSSPVQQSGSPIPSRTWYSPTQSMPPGYGPRPLPCSWQWSSFKLIFTHRGQLLKLQTSTPWSSYRKRSSPMSLYF